MSRRAAYRRLARNMQHTVSHGLPHLRPGEEFGVLPGVAEPSRADELRQGLHDRLIAMMGAARRGPVQWRTYDHDTGLRLAQQFPWPDCVERLQEWPDAVLVVALAPGIPYLWDHDHTAPSCAPEEV